MFQQEHLVAVLFEQKHSSFHETYKKKRKTAKEHCAVIFPGFAPFETDDHVSELMHRSLLASLLVQ